MLFISALIITLSVFCIYLHIITVKSEKELIKDRLRDKTLTVFDNSVNNFKKGDVSEESFNPDELPELLHEKDEEYDNQ